MTLFIHCHPSIRIYILRGGGLHFGHCYYTVPGIQQELNTFKMNG